MKAIGSSVLGRLGDLGPLLLRVGIGAVFAAHGWQKYGDGVATFAVMLGELSVPGS